MYGNQRLQKVLQKFKMNVLHFKINWNILHTFPKNYIIRITE